MTQELSAEEVAELEAAEKEASPGPWKDGPVDFISDVNGEPVIQVVLDDDGNRRIVLASRNALPRLLATLRDKQRRIEEQDTDLQRILDMACNSAKDQELFLAIQSIVSGGELKRDSEMALLHTFTQEWKAKAESAEQKLEAAMRVVSATRDYFHAGGTGKYAGRMLEALNNLDSLGKLGDRS